MSDGPQTPGAGGAFIGGTALLMIVCCVAGPAILGAVAGAAIGGILGIACAAIVAVAVGVFLYQRRAAKGDGC